MSVGDLAHIRAIQTGLIQTIEELDQEKSGASFFIYSSPGYILRKTKTRYEIHDFNGTFFPVKKNKLISWVDHRRKDWFSRLMYKWLMINGY